MGSEVGEVPKATWHGGGEKHFTTPCINWLGGRDNTGYGVIRAPKGFMGPKTGVVRVHRVSKFLSVHFPVKCQVDHLCRNRLCIRPSHLEVIGPRTHGKLSKEDQVADSE